MEMTLLRGDCLAMLRLIPDNHFDSIVTDPPYHIDSIQNRFGKAGAAPAQFGTDGAFRRASAGFMGKTWDGGDIAFRVETWREILRVLKPGGHLAAFGFSRNYHHMAVAIEQAGFEIRDSLMWIYGSGFPKAADMGKQIEAEQWQGWKTMLKPAHEPIVLARKPLAEKTVARNVLQHGVGALNIDGCRIGERYPANVMHGGVDLPPYFYCAKAPKAERAGSKHPTVKPLALIQWLCRLITPPSGKVLDPFAGTGTTLEAAILEGFNPTGIEMTPEYWPDIERRLERAKKNRCL